MPEQVMYPGIMATVSDSKQGLWPDFVELTVSTTFRKDAVMKGLLDNDSALQAAISACRRIMAELVNEDAVTSASAEEATDAWPMEDRTAVERIVDAGKAVYNQFRKNF